MRWSQLWRLPYWDPTCMFIIDSMHCLFEGLVENHCRIVLDLLVANAKSSIQLETAYKWNFHAVDEEMVNKWSKRDFTHVRHVQKMLLDSIRASDNDLEDAYTSLHRSFHKKNFNALHFVCRDLSCLPDPVGHQLNKNDFVCSLVAWHHRKPLVSANPPLPRVVTPFVISRIRDVLRDLAKPLWLNVLSSDFADFFGTKAAGSLKADKWCTFFTVFLSIALVTLWGDSTQHRTVEEAHHLRQVLDHTIALVSAVVISTSRYMTLCRAEAYCKYIKQYVGGLVELYPHVGPCMNHHISFHIYDFLLLFGPVRSWWCFPVERLVGVLQNLPSNHKSGMPLSFSYIFFHSHLLLGQMEVSIFSSYIAASKLRC